MKKTILFTMMFFCCFSTNMFSQSGTVNTQSVKSSILNQTLNYNVYLPPSYNQNPTAYYPVLYLLHGLYGNHTDWTNNGMDTVMDSEIKDGAREMIVIMPDGIDAFYCNNYDSRNIRYEDFMVQEFIPQVEQKYRIVSSRRAIAGLSMGGYGATYHAFKYQDMYSSCYSMSGAVMLEGQEPDIVTILDSKTTKQLQSMPAYTMEIGTEDFLYNRNMEFHDYLLQKDITHTFITRAGNHEWSFWRECLPKAIRFASQNFETVPTNSLSFYKVENKVYPNPAIDWVYVKAGSARVVKLCSIQGNLLDRVIVENPDVKLYVGDLSKGLYMVIIEQKNGTEVLKIIVN